MSLTTPAKEGATTARTKGRKARLGAAGRGREEEEGARGEEGKRGKGEVEQEVEGSSGKEVGEAAANARGSPFQVSL